MTKEELITKQQLQIEEQKEILEQTERLRSELKGMFYDVGQPFKDNTLKMNNRQMKWCFKIMELIEQLHVNY